MQSRMLSRWGLPAAFLLLLACENTAGQASGGFQREYLVARQALETGNYDLAIRRYGAMLPSAGPLTPRLRLEYAHSLLRGNRFDDAAREADALVDSHSGDARGSALAVRATARHEAARALIATGQNDERVRALLRQARADFELFLAQHENLDNVGAMRSRAALVASDLAGVGG